MFYHDGGKLQYEVKVDSPSLVFAKALQQAIGGIQDTSLVFRNNSLTKKSTLCHN